MYASIWLSQFSTNLSPNLGNCRKRSFGTTYEVNDNFWPMFLWRKWSCNTTIVTKIIVVSPQCVGNLSNICEKANKIRILRVDPTKFQVNKYFDALWNFSIFIKFIGYSLLCTARPCSGKAGCAVRVFYPARVLATNILLRRAMAR